MLQLDQRNGERLVSAIFVAAFHAMLLYALLTGLGFKIESIADELKIFNVSPEPPPPPPEPATPEKVVETEVVKPKDPEGAASPPNLKDTPTQIVVPPPKIPLPVPTPIPAAPIAGLGNAPAAGAADVVGPGTGRGGQGTGLGSGLQGTGTGGGGGGLGYGARARLISGRIYDSDYPRRAPDPQVTQTVGMSFVVGPNGRVNECRVTRSSGNPMLDSATCRLVKQRLRYRPARDPQGRPISEVIPGNNHVWDVRPPPPDIEVEPELVDE